MSNNTFFTPKKAISSYSLPLIEVADNLDFLSRIPDESVQLIITSPPYNIGKTYER